VTSVSTSGVVASVGIAAPAITASVVEVVLGPPLVPSRLFVAVERPLTFAAYDRILGFT
jgi:hypothetical protein